MIFPDQPKSPGLSDFVFAWPIAGVADRSLLNAAALSAFSVQHFHPECTKIFLVPEFEVATAKQLLPAWARDFVVLKGVLPPDKLLDSNFRSRWIKTHAFGILRTHTILLDADTLMVAPVDPKDLAQVKVVGAAQDRVAVNFKEIYYRKAAQGLFAKARWEWPEYCDEIYFNTGVIVYRQGVEGEAYARDWESSWGEFVDTSGLHFDQAAFNRISSKRRCVSELSVAYNTPVAILPSLARGARVYHYYSSSKRLEELRSHIMGAALAQSLADPKFSPTQLRRQLQNRRHPFVAMGMPSCAYRGSGHAAFFIRARMPELKAEVAQLAPRIFRKMRSRFRHSVQALPMPLRRLGQSVRNLF